MDASRDIALEAVVWIRKYDLTIAEIRQHGFLWSVARRMLVMPVYKSEHHCDVLYWQGKHFDPRISAKMKYQTFGNPSEYIEEVGNKEGDTIVLVEDKVSAIKVSRAGTAMPLYGSSINLKQVIKLCEKYTECVIWLDQDKLGAAIEMKDWMNVYFQKVRIVSTQFDPKGYDEQAISSTINPREHGTVLWKDAVSILNNRKKAELLTDEEEVIT